MELNHTRDPVYHTPQHTLGLIPDTKDDKNITIKENCRPVLLKIMEIHKSSTSKPNFNSTLKRNTHQDQEGSIL